MIQVSVPGKIHLLGEHTVVYGKPAILAAVSLRATVILSPKGKGSLNLFESPNELGDSSGRKVNPQNDIIRKTIEPIVKKELKLKKIPPYTSIVDSEIPIGAGLGSSAAVSAAYTAALFSFLKVKWDLALVNKLAYEAEKIFHGNPSGGDNSTVVYGGLVWFRKEHPDLKIIQPLPFSIPAKLSKNFVLINTGTPKETTKELITQTTALFDKRPKLKKDFLEQQEQLVRDLLPALKESNEKELIRIIKEGEKNLESIGVVSPYVKNIIRQIEKAGGAVKICGAGGKTKATGILLCYHPSPTVINNIAKSYGLDYFKTTLGAEGIKDES